MLDIDVAEAIRSRDEESRRWHTWHAAAIPNAKTFPKFVDFVPAKDAPSAPARRQTMDEQIAIARAWSAAVSR